MRYGVNIPLIGVPLPDHEPLLRELAGLGYTDVWTGEAAGHDGFTPLALAAAWAPGLRLGTAVVPAFTRGPALLAMTAATLAEAAQGEVVVGIGSSGPPFVDRINGISSADPYRRVRDTARFLRHAFDGRTVRGRFDSFTIDGFRLPHVPVRRPRVMIGALRPGMLRLAARESDGAITNFLAVGDVPAVADALGPARPGKELVARLYVCPTRDRTYARQMGRRLLVGILNARTYSAFHAWLGREDALKATWQAWADGDPARAADAVPDEVVDDLLVHGSPEECRAHIARFVEAGIDTPFLHLLPAPETGGGPQGALRALSALAPAR
ncbi:LLM class F420-dependent oxidoreductase [Streptomyces sp. NPDC052101]|uniref:LLM class F420-dependent oxidoreductase n=1 Tax=Streptomyces sp. NPDC052101 TaxID=3155763 RepID=UPI0034487BA9